MKHETPLSLSTGKSDGVSVKYYPVFLNINQKNCVVVGGGEVALRKVKMLLECGGKVTVITPRLTPDLGRFVEGGKVRLILRNYEIGDLQGATIVIAATDSEEINKRVSDEAIERGILVNVSDNPAQSNYIVPSFFSRGDLIIAVSTAATSPALAKKIRKRLEHDIGEEYASLLSLIGEIRSDIKKKGWVVSAETWEEALDLDWLLKLLRAGQQEKAKAELLGRLEAIKVRPQPSQGGK